MSNFDVINDTGQPCHGFEIELDGLSSTDVVYTFAAPPGAPPYIRYSTPEIVPIAGGVIVRYASPFDAMTGWAATTPSATKPYPTTMGHQCWYGGDPVNYPTSGCEHFGVSLTKNPTNTIYRWLVEGAPGTLTPFGSNVSIPAPVWNVMPQPPVPNLPPPPPVVVAVVEAPPPPENEPLWGEAIWEKIYVTELPEPPALEDLLLGGAAVPNPEIEPPEVEWQLLQSAPVGEMGPNEISENGGDAPVGADKEAVSRRYEFYKYTGQYDPESHEALCDSPTPPSDPLLCGDPDPNTGLASVGDLIGAQNAAVNLAADQCHEAAICDPVTGDCTRPDKPNGTPCDDRDACTRADTCQAGVCVGSDPLADGSACDDGYVCTQGDTCQGGVCVSGSLVTDGTACEDGNVCTQNETCQAGLCVSGNVAADGTPCDDGNACTQDDSCHAGACTSGAEVTCAASGECRLAGTCDPATGTCSDPVAPDGTGCNDGDACTQTDSCQAGVCTGANPTTCTASDQCHVAGTCDPASGICSNPAAQDGTGCNDGDACTQADTCQAGVCTGGSPDPTCASADLSLRIQGAQKQVQAKKMIEYRLRIKNHGPDAATAVMANLECMGVPYRVVEVSTGCVATGSSVTCSLGTLSPRKFVAADITIAPDATGVLSCTASASSATPDPDLTDQSETVETQIR